MRRLVRIASSLMLVVGLAGWVSQAWADPPRRVLRLSYVNGPVSFNAAGTDDWVVAPVNRPVVYGDQVWADAEGRGELALGQATLWLGPRTSVRVLDLDDRVAQFELAQGTLSLRVRRLESGDTLEIDTPNLAFVVSQPGRYRVSVDEQGDATLVAVRDGQAEVYGGSSSYVVARGQTYRFYGTDLTDTERLPPPAFDAFERFAQERDRRFDAVASARYVSTEVIGYEDLDRYGTWGSVPEYGNVWYPRDVSASWVPYREGHWSWVDPWGWTWVDDAPWGFAPFHYGRWIYARDRWGWVPGPSNVRPVYGPAFVAFVDAGSIRIAGGGGGPAVGWFPLGPRDVYRPSYAASAQYVRQVNVSNTVITNVTVLNNIIANPNAPQVNTYVNLRAPNAVTAVPPAAMAQAQTVTRIATVIPGNAIQASNIQPFARVAPAAQAVIGPARPAQAKPPAQVETRPVVARSAPPPAPPPVAQRLQTLQQNPGKPMDVRAAAPAPAAPAAGASAPRPGAPATPTVAVGPSNVRVVNAPKPAASAAPPAKAPDASRANAPRPSGPDAAAAPGAGAPPATRPGAPAGRPESAAEAPRAPAGGAPVPPRGAAEAPRPPGAPENARPPATGDNARPAAEAPRPPGAGENARGPGAADSARGPGGPARGAERPAITPPTATPPVAPGPNAPRGSERPAITPPAPTPPVAPAPNAPRGPDRPAITPPTPTPPTPPAPAAPRGADRPGATPPPSGGTPAPAPAPSERGAPPRAGAVAPAPNAPPAERAVPPRETPQGPALLPRSTPTPGPRERPAATGAPPAPAREAAPERPPEGRATPPAPPPPVPAARPPESRAPVTPPAPVAPRPADARPAAAPPPPPAAAAPAPRPPETRPAPPRPPEKAAPEKGPPGQDNRKDKDKDKDKDK